MKNNYILFLILLISSINISAQTITTLVTTGVSGPYGLILNGTDLYISEYNGDKISKIDITAITPIATDVVTGLDGPYGMVLNGNDLYIAELSGNKVSKIDITAATPVATDVVTGLNSPWGLALNGAELYISESVGNKISKIDITSTTPTAIDVVTGLGYPTGIAFNGSDLYVGEFSSNKISKINISLATPSATDYVTAISPPVALTIFGNDLYFSQDGSNFNNRIFKTDLTSTTPTTSIVVTGLPAFSKPTGHLLYNDELYFAESEGNQILKCDLSSLSISTINSLDPISLYPNPSNKLITISGLKANDNFKIYSTIGLEVKSGNISNQNEIDIKDFTNGVYFLKFENGNTLKFIKE